MSYWSDKFLNAYNKAKEISRDIRMPLHVESPIVRSRANDFSTGLNKECDMSKTKTSYAEIPSTVNVHVSNDNCEISTVNKVALISTAAVTNLKYSEPFKSSSCSGIQISESNYVDFNISKSNSILSTANVTISKNEIANNSNSLSQIKNTNDFDNFDGNLH